MKDIKQKNRTASIDFSSDRLANMASDYLDDHDYIRALKMLNKNAVHNGNDEASYTLYAECFDDMALYEKCINSWFKYIDYVGDDADLAEAYEGLVVCYLNIGQESFSAYYYNKLIAVEPNDGFSLKDRVEMIEAYMPKDENSLRFAYPPKIADYSEQIDKGLDYMRENDFENAIKEFDSVDESNKEFYFDARNYIAMCKVIIDKNDEAEQECENILSQDANNVSALTTLAAIKSQQHQKEEAAKLAERLIGLNLTRNEDIYRVATVCCECDMHTEAYSLLSKLDDHFTYDITVLFFRAVAAYNSGMVDKSLEIFDEILTVYPDATVADYWYNFILKDRKKPEEKRKKLEYFYRLPRRECEANITALTALNRLTDKNAKLVASELNLLSAVNWCFETGDRGSCEQLRLLGAFSALKAGYEDVVRDILLDINTEDSVKMELLSGLACRNGGGAYGITLCNIYKRINLVTVNFGKVGRSTFLKSYGLAFSRIAPLEESYGAKLAAAAEALYKKLESEGRLASCRSIPGLAAAMAVSAGIESAALTKKQILSFFGAKERNVDKIINGAPSAPADKPNGDN